MHAMSISRTKVYDMKSQTRNANCHLRNWLIASYIVLEVVKIVNIRNDSSVPFPFCCCCCFVCSFVWLFKTWFLCVASSKCPGTSSGYHFF